ncbi:hypothetical protein FJT64_009363 [Amphibalanus amphitrite]|uniref:Uncharacterized protein n=1 Tax=Amphibalanus amphitrite TaxID=1232801 RepID=A0A6A4VFH4_AMPAM|nr:hypothetical protein FJT64_009363 [Amphibalanus amphitrite]
MTSNGGQGQPPATRSRAASVRAADTEELKDSIVEAVVARLMQSGLVVPTAMTPAAAAAGAAAASGAATEAVPDAVAVKVEYDEEEEVGVPPPSRRRLWLEELRAQLNASPHLGVREREEARSLLIIGDTAGPPPEHRSWYWGRVRLFLIVAHHGWAAATRVVFGHKENPNHTLGHIVTMPASVGPGPGIILCLLSGTCLVDITTGSLPTRSDMALLQKMVIDQPLANHVTSPFLMSMLMSQVWLGARGSTRNEA